MNNKQDELVAKFLKAREERDAKYRAICEAFHPVRDELVAFMLENGITLIHADDRYDIELRWWKEDGVDTPTIWRRVL